MLARFNRSVTKVTHRMVSRSMAVWNHEKEAKGKIPSIPYWTGPYEGEETFADQVSVLPLYLSDFNISNVNLPY